jgi:hypothetical protein
MVKINRIYTRTGDLGETGLVDGARVPKDALRVEAYGTLDELNAALGLARVWNELGLAARSKRGVARAAARDAPARWLDGVFRKLQDELIRSEPPRRRSRIRASSARARWRSGRSRS